MLYIPFLVLELFRLFICRDYTTKKEKGQGGENVGEKYRCILNMRNAHVFLDGHEIKGIEGLKLSVGSSSNLPYGQAELELKLIVDFPGNKPEQNPSQAES